MNHKSCVSKSSKRRERRKKSKQYSQNNTKKKCKSYDHLSNNELMLLISGYIRNIQLLFIIPNDVIHFISLYHWSKLYDNFNLFRFKNNLKENKIVQNFPCLQYYVMPLNELKSKYLLPFDEIVKTIDADGKNKKIGKYSSFTSKYCPEFIKKENCFVHEVALDKNNENIYHLMDSFVVNKFIELFEYNKAGNHWQTKASVPGGKGHYRAGFRCVGHKKQPNKQATKYFNKKMKYLQLWRFMGGTFDKLILSKEDFAKKCLLKHFNIHDAEMISLLFTAFQSYGSSTTLTLDDFRFSCEEALMHLTCKAIICELLYRKSKNDLDLDDDHWLIKKLSKMKRRLMIDEEIKNAEKIQKKEENEVNEEKKEEENDAYKGNWTSWTEIKANNNNIYNDIYPWMMTGILFSTNYSYGLNSLGLFDYDDWTLQRPIFGEKFLELFRKNDENNKIRAFWCKHIAWDMFDEDYLSGDKILCCIDNEKIVVVWSLIVRLYG